MIFVPDGTLTYCLVFPTAMVHLQSMANLFAFDVVAESKVPCWVTEFSYYKRIQLAIAAPFLITGAIVGASILWARWYPPAPQRRTGGRHAALESRREEGCCARGLWKAAPYALFCLDFLYPAITRTLLQFFTCRDLGKAGKWLEADCTFRFCVCVA